MARARKLNGRVFLDAALGSAPDAELVALIERLVKERVPEDQWLDYKAGSWRADDAAERDELRKDVSAFGNADGGCLVVGVAEDAEKHPVLDACVRDVDGLALRANATATSLAGQLYPPPRSIRRVSMTTGEVLVIAVPRSARLAALSEDGIPAYYLRVGADTCRVPEYLLADLLFGRRHQPILSIRPLTDACTNEVGEGQMKVTIRFVLENVGATWAPDLHGAALFWSLPCASHTLLAEHDALAKQAAWAEPSVDRHSPPVQRGARVLEDFADGRLAPFGNRRLGFWAELPLPSTSESVEWVAAVHVGTSHGPPQRWEVRCQFSLLGWRMSVAVDELWEGLPAPAFTMR